MTGRSGMRITLQLRQPLQVLVAEAVRRQPGAMLAPAGTETDALATDDPSAAVEAARLQRSVLLFGADTTTISEVDLACERAGTTLMPAHPWRFRPSIHAAVQSLRNGELGTPGLVRVHRWDPDAIGEVTAEAILPEIDLIHWVFDAPHAKAHAVRRGNEFLQVHFGFSGGGMAIADFAFGCPGSYRSFGVIGSTGAAYANDHRNMNLLLTAGSAQAIRTGQGDLHIRAIVQEFAEAVRCGRRPLVTASDARRSSDAAQLVLDFARDARNGP